MQQCQVIEFKDKRAVDEKHPLYNNWKWIIRSHTTKQMVCEQWLDFWNFVEDVKEHPGKDFRFQRHYASKPFGPGNFRWRYKYVSTPEKREYHKHEMRAWKAKRKLSEPDYERNISLKKNYGIDIEEYNRMLAKQNGVCAICEGTEKSTAHTSKKLRALTVDHCHSTGRIRGLLCSRCNRGLGFFGDSVVSLKKAIDYLGGNLK